MNVINNALISLESDSGIALSSSITTALDNYIFEIIIDGHEREISIETIDELQRALQKLIYLSDHVN